VTSVVLNAERTEAAVVRDGRQTNDQELAAAVVEEGFGAKLVPTATVTLAVQNLACDGCPERAKAELVKVRGTKTADVRAAEGRAVVTYDTRIATTDALVRALVAAGFPARRS
jgi:mercuric ion binding protein